ncbi:hypothetical protein [Aurantimonas coralicida]|uniref:hypothetical protein n=1 Tax=Aurantimonas coralicida TaxID=182270 RepID=UPI001E4F30B4|nr:hypothetical protein [Aurantimonas coralicida]MCD1642584.1 hypothetical protein [Aurantimonas coralicida]
MTADELMGVVAFFIVVFGSIAGVWWRVEGKIEAAKKEAIRTAEREAADAQTRADGAHTVANITATHLAEYKTHVAETYVTKAGLRESTEHIMEAIAGVRGSIDAIGQRMDRVLERRPPDPNRRE